MTLSLPLQEIAWKRIIFFLFIIIVPNYLVMQTQVVGPIDDRVGIGTALDLGVILPLLLYFFGFRKRVSWVLLCGFIFCGVLLANWMIPSHADAHLTYFNAMVVVLEIGVIAFELILFLAILKRIPLLMENYQTEKRVHYHFLLSFSRAIQQTFVFKNKKWNQFGLFLRVIATDIAAVYYSFISWKRKRPVAPDSFTFHKDGGYLGVFYMLVHAMVIEVIAVHVMVAQYSHVAAWIVTIFDVYALLFIISDYQAIRLSPVILSKEGIHFQKGIRQYGFIEWCAVKGITENKRSPEEVKQDRGSVELALHGLEREQVPFVIELNRPVVINQAFGFKKSIEKVYVKMDEPYAFRDSVHLYLDAFKK
ncbi:hypothetical protein [Bacillus sp. RAR_GA_16]|uniref:hypothetical protein n=1 Tax=Bacillus sp. RAR_GA_16 TaxID=2876774 RepID=UPI001CC99B9B|nr:hypothetical protein [Bacillus sp. RAR_GA_16]MCA0173850.1 hypothetical protein [Bacillus sp. RAR_GA_16]